MLETMLKRYVQFEILCCVLFKLAFFFVLCFFFWEKDKRAKQKMIQKFLQLQLRHSVNKTSYKLHALNYNTGKIRKLNHVCE